CAMVGQADAEDLLQNSFAQAFRKIHKYDGKCKFSTWLHGIILRLAANQRRGVRRRQRLRQAFRSNRLERGRRITLEERVDARMSLGQLEKALDCLSEHKRAAFLLHHGEGLSLTEVAEVMGATVQTTHARLKSARQELVTKLETEVRHGA
ncbi:RNA polymerase sigma factor, partial [Myxococcota bacterium]